MIEEKKIYTTSDGQEFHSLDDAIKHENKHIASEKINAKTDDEVTQFVTAVKQCNEHGSDEFFAQYGDKWEMWNQKAMDSFINIVHLMEDDLKNTTVNMKIGFIDNSGSVQIEDHFRSVPRPQDHTWNSVVSSIPRGKKTKYKNMSRWDDNGVKYTLEFSDSNSTDSLYVYVMRKEEMSIEDKMDNGIKLSENNLRELVSFKEVYTDDSAECDDYSQPMKTVVDIEGQNYLIRWSRGLTVYQEDDFHSQPVKCHMEEREVIITVVDIIED